MLSILNSVRLCRVLCVRDCLHFIPFIQFTAYGRYSTVPSIRLASIGNVQPESMNKEFGIISHELAWMPKGSFDSFSGGSGTDFSYKGEDTVRIIS